MFLSSPTNGGARSNKPYRQRVSTPSATATVFTDMRTTMHQRYFSGIRLDGETQNQPAIQPARAFATRNVPEIIAKSDSRDQRGPQADRVGTGARVRRPRPLFPDGVPILGPVVPGDRNGAGQIDATDPNDATSWEAHPEGGKTAARLKRRALSHKLRLAAVAWGFSDADKDRARVHDEYATKSQAGSLRFRPH